MNLVLFDRRVLHHLLDCSKDLSQLRAVSTSEIEDLHERFCGEGIFFQREGDLVPLLRSFVADDSDRPQDAGRNVPKTISATPNQDAFAIWYNHVGQALSPGRYLLLLRKDMHSDALKSTGVVGGWLKGFVGS